MKGRIWWNLRISGVERYTYLMFLFREIDKKLCKNYTKTDICQIFIKVVALNIIFNNYETNLKRLYHTGAWEHQIDVWLCIVQNLRFSGFILYPLSFFLYSPFNVLFNCQLFSAYKPVSRNDIARRMYDVIELIDNTRSCILNNLCFFIERNWVFVTNSNFLIPTSMELNVVDFWYFKIKKFDATGFIVWNI